MFGSVVLANYIYGALGEVAELVAITPQSQMTGAMVVPPGIPLPALLFYMTYSEHGGPVTTDASAHTNSETIRLEVKAITKGTSDSEIYPVAKAQFEALAGVNTMHEFDGESWSLAFVAVGEVPLGTLVDEANIYRQLGTIYSVDVFRV